MPSHSQSQLSRFTDGETRMIYARPIAGGELFMLPDGEAEPLRAWTTKSLVCPVPGCPDPKLTTVSRQAGRRDGFRHFPGAGGHAPESLFHLQDKTTVMRWLRARHPASEVALEVALDAGRSRIADVLITARTGERLAIEVQYASLRVREWQDRHSDYANAGVPDIWLFGHFGGQMKIAGPDVKVSDVHRAVVAAGQPLVWLNPIRDELAIASTTATRRNGEHVAIPYAHGPTAEMIVAPLSEFRLGPQGLDGPVLRELANNLRMLQAESEAERRRRVRTLPVAIPRAPSPPAPIRPVRFTRPTERRVDITAERSERWLASDRRARVLASYDGDWPVHLDCRTKASLIVPFAEWQSWAFERYIDLATLGDRLLQVDMAKALAHEFEPGARSDGRALNAVEEWLDLLVFRRTLRRIDPPRGGGRGKKVARAVYLVDRFERRRTPTEIADGRG